MTFFQLSWIPGLLALLVLLLRYGYDLVLFSAVYYAVTHMTEEERNRLRRFNEKVKEMEKA